MPGFELFGEEEKKEVQDVLDNGVLMRYGFDGMRNGHYKALTLEKELAAKMQTQYAQVVSSGTAALTVALACAEIGHGDEVIMPTFTFVASFEAILSVGAIPVLCDIDDTLTLNPDAVAKCIGPKTKAIMPVHMCGSMADLKALQSLCDQHNLVLIEDACQAIGGTYDNKPLGSYGDVGCFSFDFVKTITCGEGGGLITNNTTYADRAHKYHDHGHDHIGNDRGAETHPFLGYNYRLSELNAAVGLAQLKKLDETIALQHRNYTILRNALAEIPEVTFRTVPETGVESYAFLSIFLPNEIVARATHKALGEYGVDACFYWYDNNWHYYKKWEHLLDAKSLAKFSEEIQTGLQQNNRAFPESDAWMGRTISCLIKVGWSEAEVQERAKKMVAAIKSTVLVAQE